MSRRTFLAHTATLAASAALPDVTRAEDSTAQPLKRLRVAFPTAESGFDPAQISDLYSATVIAHIIEPPYTYDHLARPVQVRPLTAAGPLVSSADFLSHTFRIQPGIFFADDPAFNGQRRELVAADYAYALRRHFDPRYKSPNRAGLADAQILGLQALYEEAVQTRQPLDYDRPVPGVEVVDRYTLRIRLGKPDPRFIHMLTSASLMGAVAREVVERYGDAIMAHPVGTGPFRLAQWRRSSLIVLARNPTFREMRFDATPAPGDALGQSILQKLGGRRLPLVDRVEFSIIEGVQPGWLAFLSGDLDMTGVPAEYAASVMQNGHAAPHLARQGIEVRRVPRPDVTYTYFNLADPVVGGMAPEKVALRRAISLAYDTEREIRQVRRGLAIAAQGVVAPQTYGFDDRTRSGMSDYDPARAKALLDLYGYTDRNGDGWRELPDGRPLVLRYPTQSDEGNRPFTELWRKCMKEVGLNMAFDYGQWGSQLKQAQAGQLMMWTLGSAASAPDGQDQLSMVYGPLKGAGNFSGFDLPEFNQLFDRMGRLPDGPERLALFARARKLMVAWMPVKAHSHRIRLLALQPWLIGYQEHPFNRDFGRYVDVDPARQPAPRA
jgi:ABC-type transport system substrate-binding protein